MPIHDWTRVAAGTWHDFHLAWIAEVRNALNGGLLPPSYDAQAEQIAGPLGPDVLITPARKFRMLLHTNPTRERGECLGTRAGASEDM